MSKKTIYLGLSLILCVSLVLFFAPFALAQGGTTGPGGDSLNPTSTLTREDLDTLNPLVIYSRDVPEDLSSPGGIIQRVLRFAFPIAGLILFLMLVWAGFEILSGAASKKSIDAGKQRATAAIIGFGLLFVSYWIAQIIEVIFGVNIL